MRFHPVALLATAILAGCAVGPDYRKPETEAPGAFSEPGPWKVAAPKDSLPKQAWWRAFGDPVLDSLESQASASSPTLRAALARVDEASAIARVSRSAFLPSLSTDLAMSRTRYSGNREFPPGSVPAPYTANSVDFPLALSYELDFFGGVRRALESARDVAQAEADDYQNVLLSLQALVAEDYFALRSLTSQEAILAHSVELRRQELDLVRERRNGGAAYDLDVYQAETELDSVTSDRIVAERQIAEVRHALAVLAGQPPGKSTVEVAPLAGEPPPIPAGIPSDLLERRPDIAESERNMAAANAGIGIAKAAFFPSISLTAYAGQNSTAFDSLLVSNSREWAIAPFVYLPLFQGGRNAANYQRSKAAYEEAVANYRQQVLVAFQDVEDALSDLRTLSDQSAALSHAAEASGKAADLSVVRYKEGVADYLQVIDAERTALAEQLLAAQVQQQRFFSSVILIKALGGGW